MTEIKICWIILIVSNSLCSELLGHQGSCVLCKSPERSSAPGGAPCRVLSPHHNSSLRTGDPQGDVLLCRGLSLHLIIRESDSLFHFWAFSDDGFNFFINNLRSVRDPVGAG